MAVQYLSPSSTLVPIAVRHWGHALVWALYHDPAFEAAAVTFGHVPHCGEASRGCQVFRESHILTWHKQLMKPVNIWAEMKSCSAAVSSHDCIATLFLWIIWQIHNNYFWMQSLSLQSSNVKYLLFCLPRAKWVFTQFVINTAVLFWGKCLFMWTALQ